VRVSRRKGSPTIPGTEELLIEGLRRGRADDRRPYPISTPIRAARSTGIFAIARDFDAEIDMHLDLAETTQGMADRICLPARPRNTVGVAGLRVGPRPRRWSLPPSRSPQCDRGAVGLCRRRRDDIAIDRFAP